MSLLRTCACLLLFLLPCTIHSPNIPTATTQPIKLDIYLQPIIWSDKSDHSRWSDKAEKYIHDVAQQLQNAIPWANIHTRSIVVRRAPAEFVDDIGWLPYWLQNTNFPTSDLKLNLVEYISDPIIKDYYIKLGASHYPENFDYFNCFLTAELLDFKWEYAVNTAIHETGHLLGLEHTWEDTRIEYPVDIHPIAKDEYDVSVDAWTNYMSYGGSAMNHFTEDQLKVMQWYYQQRLKYPELPIPKH